MAPVRFGNMGMAFRTSFVRWYAPKNVDDDPSTAADVVVIAGLQQGLSDRTAGIQRVDDLLHPCEQRSAGHQGVFDPVASARMHY